MQVWFDVFAEHAGKPDLQQVAIFRESHGFSQAHASAVVLYCRGSKTSRRYEDLDGYLQEQAPEKQALVRRIYGVIMSAYPELEQVIAWNQPMVKLGKDYIFGLSVAKNHVLIAPFNPVVLEEFLPRLGELNLNKKTIQVPVDWDVDEQLLVDMVGRGIAVVKG
ncbi:MAG: iron chaperone, partial [Armatimonadota bacterium]